MTTFKTLLNESIEGKFTFETSTNNYNDQLKKLFKSFNKVYLEKLKNI